MAGSSGGKAEAIAATAPTPTGGSEAGGGHSGIGNATRNVFIDRALRRIAQVCGTGRRNATIRAACVSIVDALPNLTTRADVSAGRLLSLCLIPLRLAAESRVVKMIEIVLDCLQKLVAYGFITGDMQWEEPTWLSPTPPWAMVASQWGDAAVQQKDAEFERKLLIHQMILTVCHNVSVHHEGVQLQIIRALISAVSTPTAGVHGHSLVTAVRNTYNIYLVSQSAVNQRTAKGTLVQMISIVFARMESAGGQPEEVESTSSLDRTPALLPAAPPDPIDVPLPASPEFNEGAKDEFPDTDPDAPVEDWMRQLVLDVVSRALPKVDAADADEHVGVAFHQEEELQQQFQRRDSTLSASANPGGAPQEQHDAFLIFRSLCKLSVKHVPESAGPDSLEMKSKLLSLELILGLLLNTGEVFRTSDRFIKAVKQNLCLSLLQNCVSPHVPVFRISLSIFLALIANFREHLKREIGVFFTNVLLVILESSNSSLQQKLLVIQAIHRLCENPQTIIDLFVNYDCELESVNIFEHMMNNLSRILQARPSADAIAEADLKVVALRALVMVLRSLVQWTDRFLGAAGSLESPSGQRRSSLVRLEDEEARALDDSVGAVPQPPTHTAPVAAGGEDEIEKARREKLEIAEHVAHFNKDFKTGLQRLWDGGVISKTPQEVAAWLRDTPGLDKTIIGEYLARTKDFESAVLNAFVELFNFSGLEIDEALRRFLGRFRICGEAQVIDRTMEKFAEVFCHHNPTAFGTAATAFILSFSVIMLNTDASNQSIQEKMTKVEFIRNNRGIDDGKDLPEQLLIAIYDRVTSRPFELEGSKAKVHAAPAKKDAKVFDNLADVLVSDGKRRAMNYEYEMRQTVTKTAELFRARGQDKAQRLFMIADRMEHARPMFEAAWAAMLPAFSVLLEQSSEEDSKAVVELCLEGFDLAIHVSCVFFLDVERDAFVSALSKMTFLSNYREIESKNLRGIKLLINIASREGNYLRSSWYAVLRCISQLERLQLLGAGAKPDFAFLDEPAPKGRNKERAVVRSARDKVHQYEHLNSQLIRHAVDETLISRIYTDTRHLTGEAIVFFVKHLCAVSAEEIEHTQPPRMFSLQKLIEVADINMDRMRLVWTQLWSHMAKHFVRVGENHSLSVSMYGIDSLRQLSMKFLAKPELTNYHFQRDFLKPFETILQRSRSIEVREFIVRCLAQMVQSQSSHIKSGWKSIFAVLAQAASDPNEQIVALAFDAVDHIFDRLLSAVVAADAFVDTVNCLIAFMCNRLSRSIAVRATSQMMYCASCLVNGVPSRPEPAAGESDELGSPRSDEGPPVRYIVKKLEPGELIDSEDRAQLRVWFPILTGLCADATQHPDVEVRLASLSTLFGVLDKHGDRFSLGMWRLVFAGSVLPVLDNAYCELALFSSLIAPTAADTEGARRNTVIVEVALSFLVDLVAGYFSVLRGLLREVLGTIVNCITKPAPPRVALIGIAALIDVICNHCEIPAEIGGRGAVPYPEGARVEKAQNDTVRLEPTPEECFAQEEWDVVASMMAQLFDSAFPSQLLHCDASLMVHTERRPETSKEGEDSPTQRHIPPRPLVTGQVVRQLNTLLVLLRTHHFLSRAVCDALPARVLITFVSCPEVVHQLAASAIADSQRAYALAAVEGGELLARLLDAESSAIRLQLVTIGRLYAKCEPPSAPIPRARSQGEVTDELSRMLHAVLPDLLGRYADSVSEESGGCLVAAKRVSALTDAVVQAVDLISDADADEFGLCCERYYGQVVDLCGVLRRPIADSVRRFFIRVGVSQLRLPGLTSSPVARSHTPDAQL
eukprot:Hpha_TRINITY_DN18338_c0_g1::TRINITY_DN18338_c0_g1_i1::g.158210::m.158210/K18442/ARFGEF, BIG; brefeldin A-inhibited guanine nucleotide-exchange protein